jgi:hypothetical protein
MDNTTDKRKVKQINFTSEQDEEIAKTKAEWLLNELDGLTINQVNLTLQWIKDFINLSVPIKFQYSPS